MKKFLGLILINLLLCSNVYANSNDRIKTDGFVIPTNKWKDKIKIDENFEVNNPKDKIIIIINLLIEDLKIFSFFSPHYIWSLPV